MLYLMIFTTLQIIKSMNCYSVICLLDVTHEIPIQYITEIIAFTVIDLLSVVLY